MDEHFLDVLRFAVKHGITDVHLRQGRPPVFRRSQQLVIQRGLPPMSESEIRSVCDVLLAQEGLRQKFDRNREVDVAYELEGVGRFRVNVFVASGRLAIAVRVLPFKVPSFGDLNLPTVLEKICQETRGLVLVTGTTGVGKSTTLASMIDYINNQRACHILTVEDPIEYRISDRRSVVSQREIGSDTPSFSEALRGALRQDPDVMLIGEMRDVETIEAALLAAETGHLVLSTLHTMDATETVNRIVMAFPPFHQAEVRRQLAGVLSAVVSQRLLPCKDGESVIPACEILVATRHAKEIVATEGRLRDLHDVIARGFSTYGMRTFDQSIMLLYTQGHISYEEALRQATNPGDFALRVSGISGADDVDWDNFILRS